MKINKNDSIIICVEKFETKKRKKILYNLLISYKYINCLMCNLFNFNEYQFNIIEKSLKQNGKFKSTISYKNIDYVFKNKKKNKTIVIKKKLTIKIAGY